MLPAERPGMILARQRRATITSGGPIVIDGKRERALLAFGRFVHDLVRDLNTKGDEGWAVLVEGKRDEQALRKLGYRGHLSTYSRFSREGRAAFQGSKKVVVLTDLDREGATLASRSVKGLAREGIRSSLSERRRLKAASRGVFLHIENLSRFEHGISVIGNPELE